MYYIIEYLRDTSTSILLYLVTKINSGTDRNLSQKLFDMAEDYNTRPGTFNYFNK